MPEFWQNFFNSIPYSKLAGRLRAVGRNKSTMHLDRLPTKELHTLESIIWSDATPMVYARRNKIKLFITKRALVVLIGIDKKVPNVRTFPLFVLQCRGKNAPCLKKQKSSVKQLWAMKKDLFNWHTRNPSSIASSMRYIILYQLIDLTMFCNV